MLITVNVAYVPISSTAKIISTIRRVCIVAYDALFTLQLGCLVSMTCKQRGLDKGLGFCGGVKGGTNGLPKGGGNRGCI